MKTLKSILFLLVLVATVTVASANEVKTSKITTPQELKELFRKKIITDFAQPSDFLNSNNIDKLKEKVEVIFMINPDQSVRIIKAKSQNPLAADYVKQILDKQTINVSNELKDYVYRVNLILEYRAI